MDNPTSNQAAGLVNSAIAATIQGVVSLAESYAIAEAPFLGFPVIKQLWEGIFGWIAGLFIRAMETTGTFTVIDVQVGGEETSVSKALAALIAAEKGGDPSAIQKAIQNYANANSALIHSDGSSPVSS